jgi:HD-GYP domain-containing protein (c-di-GMP phosphodiesterase class II)
MAELGATGPQPQSRAGFLEVPTAIFVERVDLNMPALPSVAFYRVGEDNELEKFRDAAQPYSSLALSSQKSVWIREEDFHLIKKFTENLLSNPKFSEALSTETRMETLRKSSMAVMDELFTDPSPENITRSVKVVGSFVYTLMKEPQAYLYLAKLSSHDPYTLQHSVGTSVNCIMLAKKMGITDPSELEQIGLAGLLHDVGKVKVKREIINKDGPLDELEWEEMRQHAQEGYDIVKDHPALTARTKLAIWQHHEDKNGTGYPNGLKSPEIDLYGKIVGLCDIFNALTTDRTYSKARTPFAAFQLMREKLTHKIDDTLFKHLVMVYGGKYESDAKAAG